jgi:hypothetical protein
VDTAATLTPEKITTPNTTRLSEPGPTAIIKGTAPITVEIVVINTGGE